MTKYEKHRIFLENVVDGAVAEKRGFIDAALFEKPAIWSGNFGLQWRYEKGFQDGKELLEKKEEAPCATMNG